MIHTGNSVGIEPKTTQILFPILGSICGLSTISMIYYQTMRNGHLLPDMITPPISLLGCQSPEHRTYQIGFAITGLIFFVSVKTWKDIFFPEFLKVTPTSCRLVLFGGFLFSIGCFGQGIVTLDDDFMFRVQSKQPLSYQSLLHQWFAMSFFLGAAIHCYSTIFMCFGPKSAEHIYSTNSFLLKLCFIAPSFFAWPLAEALHPINDQVYTTQRRVNVGGVAQYITVSSYILFFGSYSLDFLNKKLEILDKKIEILDEKMKCADLNKKKRDKKERYVR
jgi:hypothetical protein